MFHEKDWQTNDSFINMTRETLLVTWNSEKPEAIAFAWQGQLMMCFFLKKKKRKPNKYISPLQNTIKIYQAVTELPDEVTRILKWLLQHARYKWKSNILPL